MECQVRRRKKTIRSHRPMKSAELTSPKNVAHLKRNQPKCDDEQKKKEKSITKATAVTAKETAAKRTQPKRAACFNEEIIVVVG